MESDPRHSERLANRAADPVFAAIVDDFRAVFGPQVRVVRPLTGVTWSPIPTQVWPCKAPRAKAWRK